MNQSITVAVGSPDDLRSSIWRLWVQGDEVYFGPRQMLPTLKVSLHRTGAWHIKLGRIKVQRWRRPKDNLGIVNGLMVLVDPSVPKATFWNKAILNSNIKWIALPPSGKLVTLILLLATAGADLDSARFPVGDQILARLQKKNGESAVLIAHDMTLTTQLSEKFGEERLKIVVNVHEGRSTKSQFLDQTRAMLTFLPGAAGEMPSIYDLSLGWDNVASDFSEQ
jgi:hypothetical protein